MEGRTFLPICYFFIFISKISYCFSAQFQNSKLKLSQDAELTENLYHCLVHKWTFLDSIIVHCSKVVGVCIRVLPKPRSGLRFQSKVKWSKKLWSKSNRMRHGVGASFKILYGYNMYRYVERCKHVKSQASTVYFSQSKLGRVCTYKQHVLLLGIIGHVTVKAGNVVGKDGTPPQVPP
jgi:hypothetical protein